MFFVDEYVLLQTTWSIIQLPWRFSKNKPPGFSGIFRAYIKFPHGPPWVFWGRSKWLGDDGTDSSVKRSRPHKMLNWFLGDCEFGATSDSQNIHGTGMYLPAFS